MYNKAQKKATLNYQEKNLLRVPLNLNRETEAELVKWLYSQENRQGYIKSLILADMKKHQKEQIT